MEEKKEKKHNFAVYLPEDLVQRLDHYKQENYINSRNAAIHQLLERALLEEERDKMILQERKK